MSAMSQKIKSFVVSQLFSILAVIGLAINSYYTFASNQRDHSREISELKAAVSNINLVGSQPVVQVKDKLQVLTNDISTLKDFTFRVDKKINRIERNMDRFAWVMDELARKNGINPPKLLHEGTYE
jgi:hypothetical protein